MLHLAFDFFTNRDVEKIKEKYRSLLKYTSYNFRNVTKEEVSKNFSLLQTIINANIVGIVDRYKEGNIKEDEVFFSSPSWVYYVVIAEYSFGIDFNEYYYEIVYKQHYLNKKDKNNALLPTKFYVKRSSDPMWQHYIRRVYDLCKKEKLSYTVVNSIKDIDFLQEK